MIICNPKWQNMYDVNVDPNHPFQIHFHLNDIAMNLLKYEIKT